MTLLLWKQACKEVITSASWGSTASENIVPWHQKKYDARECVCVCLGVSVWVGVRERERESLRQWQSKNEKTKLRRVTLPWREKNTKVCVGGCACLLFVLECCTVFTRVTDSVLHLYVCVCVWERERERERRREVRWINRGRERSIFG